VIEEPPLGTIVCWFDPNDDLHATYQSTVSHLGVEESDDPHRWFLADAGLTIDSPRTWEELLAEMEHFRGPVELISNGRLS
jgi:hypothetical protein